MKVFFCVKGKNTEIIEILKNIDITQHPKQLIFQYITTNKKWLVKKSELDGNANKTWKKQSPWTTVCMRVWVDTVYINRLLSISTYKEETTMYKNYFYTTLLFNFFLYIYISIPGVGNLFGRWIKINQNASIRERFGSVKF